MQLGVKPRRIISVLLYRCICWDCVLSRSKFVNRENAGKFIDKTGNFWTVLVCFFSFLQLIFFNTFFSLSLFRLIIFQKLLQQLTHFFWSTQMMKWCKEIWHTIRAYLMLRSILKTWRQSLMRYLFKAFYSGESALLKLFHHSSYLVRFRDLICLCVLSA